MTNKEIFRKWCASRHDIPLFLRSDWMECITDQNHWDVALIGKENDVQAFLPYFKKRKVGFQLITMPPLTPYMGPWLHYPEGQKHATRLSFEKKMMDGLIEQLPETDRFIQYFYPTVSNWLPFQWKGFEQTTRYTYILPDLSSLDSIYAGLQNNVKREIKKAESLLTIAPVEEIATLFQLLEKDYGAKAEKLPITQAYLTRIFRHLQEKNSGQVFHAVDADGKVIASILLAWDRHSAYFLAGAAEPSAKTTGAMSLLLWTAIQHSSTVTEAFNFEGSIIEPIERFFRAFGAEQTPYFEIRKTKSKLLKLL